MIQSSIAEGHLLQKFMIQSSIAEGHLLQKFMIQSSIAEVYDAVIYCRRSWLSHVLQEFMMQLTQHQGQVGNVLQEGNQLILEGKQSPEVETEVHVQIGLLNNRWEELRVKAMDRQSRLVSAGRVHGYKT